MKPLIENDLGTNSRRDSHMDVSKISKGRELLASIFLAQTKQHPGGILWVPASGVHPWPG